MILRGIKVHEIAQICLILDATFGDDPLKKLFYTMFMIRLYEAFLTLSLHETCPYSVFSWSAFSRIRIEYRDLRSKSPHLFSPNVRKYGPEKLLTPILFTQCVLANAKAIRKNFRGSFPHNSYSNRAVTCLHICDALRDFTKINTPPWVFFTFFKLHKWYQIA